MELENIVANTVLLKAREGKWNNRPNSPRKKMHVVWKQTVYADVSKNASSYMDPVGYTYY